LSAAARPRFLALNLVLQLAFGLMAMTVCLPSMQDWPQLFDASQASVQLTFSAYVAAYGGLQLVWGPLSDRHGRKPVLMAGIALAIAGSAAAALAPNLWLLTLARTLQGAGTAAGMVIGRALVQDFYAPAERTRMMAFVGMTMGFVPPTATLLGGQLHVRIGWQAGFWLMAVLGAVLLAMAWRGLPGGAPQAATARGWRDLLAGYAQLAREPVFRWFVLLLAVTTATFYVFLAGAPIVLKGYGVTPERLGWYIMTPPIAYIAGNLLTSRLVRTHSDRFIMLAGQGCTLASLLVLLALGWWGPRDPLAFSLPLLLLGLGHGLLVPPTLAGTVGLVPALAGSAAAVAGLMQQVGGAVGGYLVGLVPHDGQVNLAAQMLAWAAAGAMALWVLTARHGVGHHARSAA
jgi:DHA1 family bicyclomycin/chloramphenicol resistance-like MFS transporter